MFASLNRVQTPRLMMSSKRAGGALKPGVGLSGLVQAAGTKLFIRVLGRPSRTDLNQSRTIVQAFFPV